MLSLVLDDKGVKLVEMFPLLNPHALHHMPFGDAHRCQPVITIHKTLLPDLGGPMEYES